MMSGPHGRGGINIVKQWAVVNREMPMSSAVHYEILHEVYTSYFKPATSVETFTPWAA